MAPPRDPELDQPDAPRAVDAPGIGPTLRRSRRWAVTLTVVALALFVGVVTIAWPVLHHHYERTQEHLDRYRKARSPWWRTARSS